MKGGALLLLTSDLIAAASQAIFLYAAVRIIVRKEKVDFWTSFSFTIAYGLFTLAMLMSGLYVSTTGGVIGTFLWAVITGMSEQQ